MGAHICGFCNTVPCECVSQDDPGDSNRPVVGRITQLSSVPDRESASMFPPQVRMSVDPITGQEDHHKPKMSRRTDKDGIENVSEIPNIIADAVLGPRAKGIVADPATGEGDARGCENAGEPVERKEDIGNDLSAGGGLRFNAGKNKMELTPPEWDWALADVTTQGSKKYAARNWEQGMEWSVMVGCMKRHLAKFEAGERYDGSEFNIEAGTTGCHHLAMVAWNALALMSYDLRGIGKNDLPKAVTVELLNRVNAMTTDMEDQHGTDG